MKSVFYWGAWFFAWVQGLIAIGAVIGALAFPLWGVFFETGRSAGQLAVSGARFFGFIFMIWAPAIALVACVMKAWRRKQANASRAEM